MFGLSYEQWSTMSKEEREAWAIAHRRERLEDAACAAMTGLIASNRIERSAFAAQETARQAWDYAESLLTEGSKRRAGDPDGT